MAERGKNTGGKGRQKPVVVPEYRISLLQGSENRIKSSTFDAR